MSSWRSGALPAAALVVAGLVATTAAATSSPESASAAPRAEWEVLDRRPAAGEQCIVCRQGVHDGDIVELRYKGRRFFVAAGMVDEFEADPDHFFEILRPHSGLFDEAAMDMQPMASGWLVFGIYVLVGLIFGAACSYVALDRGQPALPWFFSGLLVNALALAAVLSRESRPDGLRRPPPGLTKIPATHAPVACPVCGRPNHPSAPGCSDCGHDLHPTVEADTARI